MIREDRVGQILSLLQQSRTHPRLTGLQIAVIMCTLSTVFIRLYGAMLPDEEWYLRVLSLFHGLSFLGLLALFFLPRFASRHHEVSFVLAGYAWMSVMLWVLFGLSYDIVGYIVSSIEACLAVFAFYDGCRSLRFSPPLRHEEIPEN